MRREGKEWEKNWMGVRERIRVKTSKSSLKSSFKKRVNLRIIIRSMKVHPHHQKLQSYTSCKCTQKTKYLQQRICKRTAQVNFIKRPHRVAKITKQSQFLVQALIKMKPELRVSRATMTLQEAQEMQTMVKR